MNIFLLITASAMLSQCSSSADAPSPTNPTPVPPVVTNEMDFWLTKGNQSVMLQKQSSILAFSTT
ncbi:MAG TPA: glucosylceramidase, partial [Flavobacterium sp.]|nr:glucosylceramidase [Flavobacterium sp.]